MPSFKLSVVIVNYNVQYFLEQALYAVRKAAMQVPTEIFVVDNASVDGSVNMVRAQFPEVRLIANSENVGFSAANNQAIRQAAGEYVLLLNPDTVVEEDTFGKVVAFMDATPDAGGLGVKMIDGSGKFLPESKRGFPSPWVAFCKTFGLSRVFPKSRWFNHYHLGYLDADQTHRVEVLSGAFMLLRGSVLAEVGLLDEAFFMYGEDIDLSYRILQAGFSNYYFPQTTIIHYKGESTKKGTLNYVHTFYNAMIIFARKHFESRAAKRYVWMIRGAIYFRAGLTLASNWAKKGFLPLVDAGMVAAGLFWLKDFWAVTYFNDPNYYNDLFLQFNLPLYTSVWLLAVYLGGGYDRPFRLERVLRGMFVGTVLLAAVYGLLDLAYRNSRMLLLLGAVWATLVLLANRWILHFAQYRTFRLSPTRRKNFAIVGSETEAKRVLGLIYQAQVPNNFIGIVAPTAEATANASFIGSLAQLEALTRIYNLHEIIFCAESVPAQAIMSRMTQLGSHLEYKIVPPQSLSIIGSTSKNSPGELYTIEVQYQIVQPASRRNKRLLDILLTLALAALSPVLGWAMRSPRGFFQNLWAVATGAKTWVGYHPTPRHPAAVRLPRLATGVVSAAQSTAFAAQLSDTATLERINFFYAKDYCVETDLRIVVRNWRSLGQRSFFA